MKIFVTGGAGFIGKHLAKVLIEQNHEVTIYDNFSNSAKDDLDKSPFNKAHIITGDIGKFEDILKSSVEIDVMIHLAAKISVSESISNPKETFDTNVNGTENVLKACNANKIKKLMRSYGLGQGATMDDMLAKPKSRKLLEGLIGELGDILWYTAMAARELNATLDTVAEANIHKLSQRVKNDAIEGDGDGGRG